VSWYLRVALLGGLSLLLSVSDTSSIYHFLFVTTTLDKISWSVFPIKLFQASLIFTGYAAAYLSGTSFRGSSIAFTPSLARKYYLRYVKVF